MPTISARHQWSSMVGQLLAVSIPSCDRPGDENKERTFFWMMGSLAPLHSSTFSRPPLLQPYAQTNATDADAGSRPAPNGNGLGILASTTTVFRSVSLRPCMPHFFASPSLPRERPCPSTFASSCRDLRLAGFEALCPARDPSLPYRKNWAHSTASRR